MSKQFCTCMYQIYISKIFFAGCAVTGYIPSIQIFSGEVAQPGHRGWLCGLSVPITAIGVLTMYVVGTWMPWHFAAATCIPVPIIMIICLMFFWDSPYWYAQSGMNEWALDAIEQFRGEDADINQEAYNILDYADHESNYWFFEGRVV